MNFCLNHTRFGMKIAKLQNVTWCQLPFSTSHNSDVFAAKLKFITENDSNKLTLRMHQILSSWL